MREGPEAPHFRLLFGLFVGAAAVEIKIGQLGQRGHSPTGLRRVDFRIDHWLVLADCPGGKSDLAPVRVDAQDFEVQFLTELHHFLWFGDPLLGQFRDMAESLKIVVQLDKGAKAGETGDLAADYVTRLVVVNESLPSIRLQILDGKGQPAILDIDAGNHRFDLLPLLQHLARVLDAAGPGNVRHMHQSVHAVFDLDKSSEVGQITHPTLDPGPDLIPLMKRAPGIVLNLLHAEADAAGLRIDCEDFDLDRIAGIHQLARVLNALGPAHLRDMDQTFDAALQLDKRT